MYEMKRGWAWLAETQGRPPTSTYIDVDLPDTIEGFELGSKTEKALETFTDEHNYEMKKERTAYHNPLTDKLHTSVRLEAHKEQDIFSKYFSPDQDYFVMHIVDDAVYDTLGIDGIGNIPDPDIESFIDDLHDEL